MGTATVYEAMAPSEEKLVGLIAHMTRKMLMEAFSESHLNLDQKNVIRLILGEAVTNACVHSPPGGKITIQPTFSEQGVKLQISNPCEHFDCSRLEGDLPDHGRGLGMIENLVERLCSTGLSAKSSYESNPNASGGMEVTFTFSLSW